MEAVLSRSGHIQGFPIGAAEGESGDISRHIENHRHDLFPIGGNNRHRRSGMMRFGPRNVQITEPIDRQPLQPPDPTEQARIAIRRRRKILDFRTQLLHRQKELPVARYPGLIERESPHAAAIRVGNLRGDVEKIGSRREADSVRMHDSRLGDRRRFAWREVTRTSIGKAGPVKRAVRMATDEMGRADIGARADFSLRAIGTELHDPVENILLLFRDDQIPLRIDRASHRMGQLLEHAKLIRRRVGHQALADPIGENQLPVPPCHAGRGQQRRSFDRRRTENARNRRILFEA
nr:gluconolactonase [uncultured bacterium]